jgi:hypothetical protein
MALYEQDKEAKIYFGGDTTEEAVKLNSERQKRDSEDAAKYWL